MSLHTNRTLGIVFGLQAALLGGLEAVFHRGWPLWRIGLDLGSTPSVILVWVPVVFGFAIASTLMSPRVWHEMVILRHGRLGIWWTRYVLQVGLWAVLDGAMCSLWLVPWQILRGHGVALPIHRELGLAVAHWSLAGVVVRWAVPLVGALWVEGVVVTVAFALHRVVGALVLVGWTVGTFALWMTGMPPISLWAPPLAGFIRSYAGAGGSRHGLPFAAWILSDGVVGGIATLAGWLWHGWGPARRPR